MVVWTDSENGKQYQLAKSVFVEHGESGCPELFQTWEAITDDENVDVRRIVEKSHGRNEQDAA